MTYLSLHIIFAKFSRDSRIFKKYTVIFKNRPYRHLQGRFQGMILLCFYKNQNKLFHGVLRLPFIFFLIVVKRGMKVLFLDISLHLKTKRQARTPVSYQNHVLNIYRPIGGLPPPIGGIPPPIIPPRIPPPIGPPAAPPRIPPRPMPIPRPPRLFPNVPNL